MTIIIKEGSYLFFNETEIIDDYFKKIHSNYQEAKIKRVNDKGEDIPEKCDECGSKIGLFLKGEPVLLCSNKKCGKYFGTLPCTIQEGTTDNSEENHNDLMDETFYRIEYKGIGIYEALHETMSVDEWRDFKQSDAATWLPVPPNYQPGDKSFFTKKGYNKFMKLTYPYVLRYLDESNVRKFECELNPTYIRYMDEYQVVFNKTKRIQESTLPDGVFLRPANESDLPNIIKWKLESVNPKTRNDPNTIRFIENDAKENLKDTKMIMLYSTVIGVLESCYIDDGEWWYIGEIYLIPEYRGKGIARVILQQEIYSHDKLKLRVSKDNTHAIDLYKSLGFGIYEEDEYAYTMTLVKDNMQELANEKISQQCISYAMGIDSSIMQLKKDGFIINEDDGDYEVRFDSSKSSIWENYISDHMKNTYWNEYINLDTHVIHFMIKDNGPIEHVINNGFEENPELLKTCNRLCEGDFKSIKELMLSNDFYKKYISSWDAYIQEGTWQDIRNGVNPKSKKLFFHISMDSKMNGKTLEPRIPSYISEKGSKSDKYKEDETTPRVCFSPSIEGCLNAIISTQKNLDIVGKNIFVYVPEKEISEYKIKTNKELIKEKLVFDATTTGEMWILEPVKLKLYGVIVVDQVKNVHEKKTVDGIPHGRFDYKWHWAVTPKYVERTLDRQVTYDEWLKQASKENNKTIKECVTMSNYPSRFMDPDATSGVSDFDDNDINDDEFVIEAKYSRFNNSLFMEDGEDTDDEDEDLDKTLSDLESSSDNDDSNDDNIDISSFGSDISDVQNDYSQKDIEILNHLIAGESEAINDYFDGAKDSNDETLRRLYGDIGHEERFHLEQLLYAKSTLTGEKYEPRDPEVKKEYEELLAMGMDEETAASTAIDKQSMIEHDDGDDSDMEEIEQEAAILETMLFHNEIITTFCEQFSHNKTDEAISVFIEAFFQEEMDNAASAPKEVKNIQSPVKLLAKGLKASINGLIRMSSIIRDSMTKSKLKNYRKMEWLKKNGIQGLFANGIHLYFYSDKLNKFDTETPARYVDLLYRLTKQIGENCGIRLTQAAQHKTITNAIRFNSISDGLNILKQVVLSKTKVVVNDKNKDMLEKEFFGYTNEKINVAVTHGNNDTTVRDSNNIYNRLEVLALLTKEYCKISDEVLENLMKFEGDANSIYYKNRQMYNRGYDGMKLIVSKYNEFIKAMAHDLKVIIRLDNGLLALTRERDTTEQSGGKWDGPDIRTTNGTMSQGTPNNYSTNKKLPKNPHKW